MRIHKYYEVDDRGRKSMGCISHSPDRHGSLIGIKCKSHHRDMEFSGHIIIVVLPADNLGFVLFPQPCYKSNNFSYLACGGLFAIAIFPIICPHVGRNNTRPLLCRFGLHCMLCQTPSCLYYVVSIQVLSTYLSRHSRYERGLQRQEFFNHSYGGNAGGALRIQSS